MNSLALLSVILGGSGEEDLEKRISSNRQKHHADTEKPIFTPRESEVLYWASMGKTYGEIAAIASISPSTVKFHMRNIVVKLGVSNARQAIRLGVELGLMTPSAAR